MFLIVYGREPRASHKYKEITRLLLQYDYEVEVKGQKKSYIKNRAHYRYQ